MDIELEDIYSQTGGSLPHYSGVHRHQLGGGFLGGLLRMALPFLKTVGKSALKVGAQTASDVIQNPEITLKDSLKRNAAREFINKVGNKENSTIFKHKIAQNVRSAKRKK